MRSTSQPAAPSLVRRAVVTALCTAAGLGAATIATPAAAQAYPNKTIRMQEAMAKIGVNLLGSTPEQNAQFIRVELDKHSVLARRGGAKLD